MDTPIRTFIAVPIPDSVRKRIGEFQGDLIKTRADVKWVNPECMHITLKFLGDVEDRAVGEVIRRTDEAIQSLHPFSIRLAGTGFFPDAKRPNVLWIGTGEGAETLAELAERVDAALSPMGFDREKRAFRSHITLGRVRSLGRIDEVVRQFQVFPFDTGAFTAGAVQVMRSDLHPSGARHTTLATINLKG